MAKANLLTKLGCFLFGHDWSMYCGYDQVRVHPKAVCVKCGTRAEDMEW